MGTDPGSFLKDKDGCNFAAIADQYIEGTAGGGRIHDLEADAAPGQRKDEFTRRKFRLCAGAEQYHLRICRQELSEVVFTQLIDSGCLPVANNFVR